MRTYPITPTPEDDERFAFGLVHDAAQLIERHGYPKVENGRDLLELQAALYAFLYGRTS